MHLPNRESIQRSRRVCLVRWDSEESRRKGSHGQGRPRGAAPPPHSETLRMVVLFRKFLRGNTSSLLTRLEEFTPVAPPAGLYVRGHPVSYVFNHTHSLFDPSTDTLTLESCRLGSMEDLKSWGGRCRRASKPWIKHACDLRMQIETESYSLNDNITERA